MNKIIGILSVLLTFNSCVKQYNIAGNSTVDGLNGKMLYLRVSNDANSSVALDSCEVVHGHFQFMGDVDSIVMAHLYMGNQSVMPVVIENGNLIVQMDRIIQRVTGSPLNDRLYSFFQKKNRLENEMWELEQGCIRLMRNGQWDEKEARKYRAAVERLNEKAEELETKFVMDNYENILGPSLFMLLCSQFPVPVMTEQIDKIVRRAPQQFMCNPFVENYVRVARMNSRRGKSRKDDE